MDENKLFSWKQTVGTDALQATYLPTNDVFCLAYKLHANKKIFLFIDNCSAHVSTDNLPILKMSQFSSYHEIQQT